MVLDGPINCDAFVAYVRQVLVPDLSPGGIVIMDNLSNRSNGTLDGLCTVADTPET